MTTRTDFESYLRGPAYILDNEAETLSLYAKKSPANKPIIEIGVGYGGSTTVLLCNAPLSCDIYSVDPFVKDSMGDWQASKVEAVDGVGRAVRNLIPKTAEKSLSRWRLHSVTSDNFFENTSASEKLSEIGLCFIDGDHTYEVVKRDANYLVDKIVFNGYLIFHDARRETNLPDKDGYFRGWSGPTRLVKELLEKRADFTLADQSGSMVVLKRGISSNSKVLE